MVGKRCEELEFLVVRIQWPAVQPQVVAGHGSGKGLERNPALALTPPGTVSDTLHSHHKQGNAIVSKVTWKTEPGVHYYPAAASYLSLIAAPNQVSYYKAKDMLRASGLPLLPPDNPHVAADLAKVKNDKPLSPVPLVRRDLTRATPLQIADGCHRVCASYHLDDNTDIPCRITPHPHHT
jgi:hypothetical protein